MVRMRAAVGVVGLLVAASLASCGGSSTNSHRLSAAPGFDPAARTIRVAIFSGGSGADGDQAKGLTDGAKTWFDYFNNGGGGIARRYKVVADVTDTSKTDPAGAYNSQHARDAVVAQIVGSSATEALLPSLNRDNVVGATTSHEARWVEEPHLLPLGLPTEVEAIDALHYAVESLEARSKVLCPAAEGSEGAAMLRGLDFGAPRESVAPKAPTQLSASGSDAGSAVSTMQTQHCDLVFLEASPSVAQRVLEAAQAAQLDARWVLGSHSYVSSFVHGPLGGYVTSHVLVAGEGPAWGASGVPGMDDMLARKAKYAPDATPDPAFIEGYTQAWAVTDLLDKAAAAGDLGRRGISSALSDLGSLHFDELTGIFEYGRPGERHPPLDATIFRTDSSAADGLVADKYQFTADAAHQFKL